MDDMKIRLAAFSWLEDQAQKHGDVFDRSTLAKGFVLEGQRIHLISPARGIFKPKQLPKIPLSITTTTTGPYEDSMSSEGLILYKYFGNDPQHSDNAGLHQAMLQRTPLIYFYSLMPGKYMAVWPVYIVYNDKKSLTFSVEVDLSYIDKYFRIGDRGTCPTETATDLRAYITTSVKQRLHQRSFRERVLHAYRTQCAFCRLKHAELLDAAHIIPDGEPKGDPVVNNGLALCKLHHAAFDNFFLAVKPDYTIEIRKDILKERDGPMLIHGLQGLQGSRIIIPRSLEKRPSPDRLAIRFERFLSHVR